MRAWAGATVVRGGGGEAHLLLGARSLVGDVAALVEVVDDVLLERVEVAATVVRLRLLALDKSPAVGGVRETRERRAAQRTAALVAPRRGRDAAHTSKSRGAAASPRALT